MNLFISANDNYIYPTRVMLTSFLLNNKSEHHRIYFMHSAVTAENLQLLTALVGQYSADLILIQVNADEFMGFHATGRFPVETYFRFLIAKYLPVTEDRALWLDVDLIVNGSLESFYYQDFDGSHLIGCRDIGNHEEKLQKLGCPSDSVYINAGVLLFNADLMRSYQLSDYLAYYTEHEKDITWFDQDVINGMFAGRIKILDYETYNVQVLWNRKKQNNFEQCVIAHYIGPYKPWHSEHTNPSAELWDRYHVITFKENSVYILKRKLHRLIQKNVWIPFRIFRSKIYENSSILRKLRNAIRRT